MKLWLHKHIQARMVEQPDAITSRSPGRIPVAHGIRLMLVSKMDVSSIAEIILPDLLIPVHFFCPQGNEPVGRAYFVVQRLFFVFLVERPGQNTDYDGKDQ